MCYVLGSSALCYVLDTRARCCFCALLLCSWCSIPVAMCYLLVTCVMCFLYVSIYHRSDKLKVACFAMQSLLKECEMQKSSGALCVWTTAAVGDGQQSPSWEPTNGSRSQFKEVAGEGSQWRGRKVKMEDGLLMELTWGRGGEGGHLSSSSEDTSSTMADRFTLVPAKENAQQTSNNQTDCEGICMFSLVSQPCFLCLDFVFLCLPHGRRPTTDTGKQEEPPPSPPLDTTLYWTVPQCQPTSSAFWLMMSAGDKGNRMMCSLLQQSFFSFLFFPTFNSLL